MVLRIKIVLLQVPSRLFWFAPVILLLLLKWKSRSITKHLMPGPSTKQLVLFSLESWCFQTRKCFPRLRLGKHQNSRENKTNCFPRGLTLSVYCPFKCFIEWYNYVVLIVCQDLFLIPFPIMVFMTVHEHRMQEYSKCRMYQMNMKFRSKMQTKMILRPLVPTSVHSNTRGDVKRLVYALPAPGLSCSKHG